MVLERTRCDTSLGLLTLRFREMLSLTADGVLDLNVVCQELSVSKRRVYDVTNVLEGIKLIKKKSKNHIQWLGGEMSVLMNRELEDLTEEESKLDELIRSCSWQINQLCEDRHCQRYAYLTYEDVTSVPSLKDQTVIVIKAPTETKLQVPHPEESFQVHLSSIHGPIDVYLCSDKPVPTAAAGKSSKSSHLNPTTRGNDFFLPLRWLSFIKGGFKEDAGSNRSGTQHPSLVNTTRTPNSKVQHHFAAPSLAFSVEGSDYLLSLANNEGITDLFSASSEQSPMEVPLT